MALIMAMSPATSAPRTSASRPALPGGTLLPKDFNFDAQDDLAIGAPGEDVGAIADAGAVTIVYGKDRLPAQTFRQGADGVAGGAERGDRFGAAVTGGYFGMSPLGRHNYDGDGYLDFGVGAPGETVNGQRAAGAVSVLYGCCPGPYVIERLIYQGHDGVGGVSEAGDNFGAALA